MTSGRGFCKRTYPMRSPSMFCGASKKRLTAEIKNARAAIKLAAAREADEVEVVRLALTAAANCEETYRRAPGKVRRLFNQAFFAAVYLHDAEIAGAELTEPYADLLSERLGVEAKAATARNGASEPVPDLVLSGPGSNIASKG